MKSLLNKLLKVLIKQLDKVDNQIKKIKKMLAISEYNHEEILTIF
jgi:hypothetical protein